MPVDELASAPLLFRYRPDYSFSTLLRDLLRQVYKRQTDNRSVINVGIVLHYLIYAQLELMLAGKNIEIRHNAMSVGNVRAAQPSNFVIKQMAIYVTTLPTLNLIKKCKENLKVGLFPIIITIQEKIEAAETLTKAKGLANRIEILSAEQFLTINFYQLSNFGEIEYSTTLETLVSMYNTLIDRYETDPSLRISIGK